MALQPPFFNKREPEPLGSRPGVNPNAQALAGGPPTATTRAGAHTTAAAPAPAVVTGEGGKAPGATTGVAESKLTVGPNIKLKGVEITDCDTLLVEGSVEATMDSRVIQITERGAFKGSAEIDIAEIRGVFEGELTVRQRLVIYASGRVSGKVRYGKLVIEEGGQLSGEVQSATGAARDAAGPVAA